jgi:hypothetical protein
MRLPTIVFIISIDITMVAVLVRILALMCSGYFFLVFSFPFLLPLLGIILVVFLFGITGFPFLMAYVL